MKSSMAGLSIGLMALLLSPIACGQAITARIRITGDFIGSNGRVTASHIQDGVYYRTSTGETLTHYTTFDGAPTAGEMAWAVLIDHNLIYQLDYAMHRAYVVSPTRFTPPRPPKVQAAPEQSSVEGISCRLLPIYSVTAGTVTRVGSSCYSGTYKLTLKTDVSNAGPDGRSVHNVMEMYAIQIGLEPDPNLFDLGHNFTIYRPDATEPLPSTGK